MGATIAQASNMAVCQACGREGCIACMRACRIAGRSAGLWQIQNYRFLFLCVTAKKCCTRCELSKQALYISLVCCFFEGGILPPKEETDSKVINALLSVWIFWFHRSVISSMGTLPVRPWNMQVFSDQYTRSMRGRLFRKRLAAWTCRFQSRFAHNFVPIERWAYDGNFIHRYIWM